MIIVANRSQVAIVPASVAARLRSSLAFDDRFIDPLAIPAELNVIDLVAITDPRTPWPGSMRNTTRPTVALLGDDPGGPDGLGGPSAWRCASRIGGWAKAVIVHGAGGDQQHYRAAVTLAQALGRVAFIESTSKHAQAWTDQIACLRTLTILPRTGSHPVAAGAGVVQ